MKTRIMRGWVYVPPEDRVFDLKWECACGCGWRVSVHPDAHPPGIWDTVHRKREKEKRNERA